MSTPQATLWTAAGAPAGGARAEPVREPGLLALLLRRSALRLVAAAALGLAAGALFAASIVVVDQQLRAALAGTPLPLTLLGPQGALALLGIGAITLLSLLSARVTAGLLLNELNALRTQLVQRLFASSWAALQRLGARAALAALVDEVQRVAQGLWALPVLLMNLGICLAAYAWVASVNATLLALLLGLQVLGLLVAGLVFVRFLPQSNAAAEERQRLLDHLQTAVEQFRGFKQSRAQQQAFVQELLLPTLARLRQRALTASGSVALMDALVKANFLLVLLVLAALTARPAWFSAAELQSALLAFMFVVTPLSAVLDSVQKLAESAQAWRRLGAVAFEPEAEPATGAEAAPPPQRLALRAACHRYDRGGFANAPVDIELRPGHVLLLQGGNGSGKTTVAHLLCGLLPCTSGGLWVDGRAVGAADLPAVREQVAALWAGQEPTQVWIPERSAAQACLHWQALGLESVQPFASGWVDCRAMSTGQRSRAALVAALSLERRFLVLDEWAAHQDTEHREWFYGPLLAQLRSRGCAVLLIAHDAAAAAAADELVCLSREASSGVALATAAAGARP